MHHDSTERPSIASTDGRSTGKTVVTSEAAAAVPAYPLSTPHLNVHGLQVLDKKDGKGRGVFASKAMSRGQLLEVSPVLLLSKEEYARPGGVGESVLKDYVFSWDKQGCMAVALGLGEQLAHIFSVH